MSDSAMVTGAGGDLVIMAVRDIRLSFGGLVALNNVSFDVRQGQIRSVIGPNGAGKTSLFNVISGILKPDAGTIHFRQRPITGKAPYRIGGLGLSRTFQHLSLFGNMTVLENVMVGAHRLGKCGILPSVLRLPRQRREEKWIRDRALAKLDHVGLADDAEKPVGSLPFGKRRQVELARALAGDPALILLDEPASGLNTRETLDLGKTICQIRDSGVTVLLVEHDMSLVMDISDRILVLNFGVPVADGVPADIRSNRDVIAVYLGGDPDSAAD